jgi:hypothetical protein
VAAGNQATWIREAVQTDFGTFELVGGDDTDGRMCFSHVHHALNAVWKQPVVGLDHLAVLTRGGDASQSKVVILYLGQKMFRTDEPDSIRKKPSVPLGDFVRSVGAAIVHKDVFPILVSLVQDAFDAFCEVVSRVIKGRYDAD